MHGLLQSAMTQGRDLLNVYVTTVATVKAGEKGAGGSGGVVDQVQRASPRFSSYS